MLNLNILLFKNIYKDKIDNKVKGPWEKELAKKELLCLQALFPFFWVKWILLGKIMNSKKIAWFIFICCIWTLFIYLCCWKYMLVRLQWMALISCPWVTPFEENYQPKDITKVGMCYLFWLCLYLQWSVDLWMSKGGPNLLVLVVKFWSVNW